MAYCSECGSKLNAGAQLCDNCGVDLSETAPEKTFERRQIDFGPVTNAVKALTTRFPILCNTKVQAGIATIAIVLASFLYSDWRPDIGKFYNEQTSDKNATGTDFSTYEDDFLSELIGLQTTSVANVRNYPTSRNTNKLDRLSPGLKLSGRWVRGFDPTTKWLKLETGGYVWEGNLTNESDQQNGAGPVFPDNIIGTWSDKGNCSGGDLNYDVTIADRMISFPEKRGSLERVSEAENGNPVFHLKMSGEGATWAAAYSISFNASGRMIFIRLMNTAVEDELGLWDAYLKCDQLF